MLSAVGESAQAALQAGTVTSRSDSKPAGRSLPGSTVKRPRDTVTISPEAVQRTHAALNSTEKSHDHPAQLQEEPAVT